MEELKKLYQARAILATTASGVPSDLQQRIAAEENRVLNGRLHDFYAAANKLLQDIETPMIVRIISDPNADGVVVTLEPINSDSGRTEPTVVVESGFAQYLNELDIAPSSIASYKRAIDDELILKLADEYAGETDLEQITDLDIISSMIENVPTKRYKGGFPHAMLVHYRKYLLASGKAEPKEDKPSRTRSIPNRGLAVVFSDGTIINEKQAAETLRQAIIKIGPERVRPLGLTQCGLPFIADFKSDNPNYSRAQKPVGNGLYVMTCSDTPTKKKQLEEIAKRLGIKLRVAVKE